MNERQQSSLASRIYEMWRDKQFAAADALLEAHLTEEPEDGRCWELRGLTRMKMEDDAEALRCLETASASVPLSALGQCGLAECYLQAGKRELAREMLTYLAAEVRCCTALLPRLAANLGQVGEQRLALQVCREASQREPDRDEPLYAMAYYMRKLQYPTATIASILNRALQLAPESTVYRVALANLYRESERWQEAYQVARGLLPQRIGCSRCVGYLLKVFREAGDERLCRVWQDRLQQLIEQKG